MNAESAKQLARQAIESHREQLIGISHDLWAHPELCFEEVYAHQRLTDCLEQSGFAVERGAYGLPTAFRAEFGSGHGPTLAIVCEYDALPGIGHACGHNIIAAAGIGAALGAQHVVEALDGKLVVLGTPAEEGGGGKVYMIERGALDGIDAAMMVHPADQDLNAFWAIAIHELQAEYRGLAAHAAAAPHLGRNALDAAVLGYMNVAALRQHIQSHERIHGVFTNGGDKANIVPAFASQQWYVRSGTSESLEALKPRVIAALQAGAIATGCDVSFQWAETSYQDLLLSSVLDQVYAANAFSLGRGVAPREEAPALMGSTDMGNISHRVPSLHPMIKAAPAGVAIHTEEFATHTAGPLGDSAVIDGALAMAFTAIDCWVNPQIVSDATSALKQGS